MPEYPEVVFKVARKKEKKETLNVKVITPGGNANRCGFEPSQK